MRPLILAFIIFLLGTFNVQAGDRDAIIKSCHAELKMSAKGCECIADKVEAEFNEAQQAFFMGIITRDQAAMAAAQKNLTPNDMTVISGKMEQLPKVCAQG